MTIEENHSARGRGGVRFKKGFFKKTKIDVRVVAVGTGQAIRTAQDGNAEILLVHDKSSEIELNPLTESCQKKLYGGVPPETDKSIEPSVNPKHEI